MHTQRFTVRAVFLGDAALVSLHGPVDRHAGEALDNLLDELSPLLTTLVVDAEDVPSMDGTGCHFLLRLFRFAESRQILLRTHGWQQQPQLMYGLATHVHAAGEERPADAVHGCRRLRAGVTARASLQRDRGMRQALR
ncbi:STAS domain-containing protein, partial [Streptomyces sparsus]